jgi:hypothetical protein
MMPRSRITDGPHEAAISIRPSQGEGRFLAIMFSAWTLLILCFLAFTFRHESGETVSILLRIAVASGLLLSGISWIQDLSKGPTLIRLEPEYIVITRKLFGLSWTRTMNSRHVSNLRSHYRYTCELGASIIPGVVIDYLGKERCLIGDLSEEEAEYLVDRIKRYYQNLNMYLQADSIGNR